MSKRTQPPVSDFDPNFTLSHTHSHTLPANTLTPSDTLKSEHPISHTNPHHPSLHPSLHPQITPQTQSQIVPQTSSQPPTRNKRRAAQAASSQSASSSAAANYNNMQANTNTNMNMNTGAAGEEMASSSTGNMQPPAKKSRTNTPWTPAEEQRLKNMRDAGNSWADIAKTFPARTEGSVKKHWYKDMHYAEFAEDESQALLAAIKDYEANKWKAIGAKVGKPAKACEQYAKDNFGGKI